MNDVFDAATGTQSTSEFFGGGDFYLVASGSFQGSVYLERQVPGNSEWDMVADSRVRPGYESRVATYSGVKYRLTASIKGGTAYCYSTLIRNSNELEVHPLSKFE